MVASMGWPTDDECQCNHSYELLTLSKPPTGLAGRCLTPFVTYHWGVYLGVSGTRVLSPHARLYILKLVTPCLVTFYCIHLLVWFLLSRLRPLYRSIRVFYLASAAACVITVIFSPYGPSSITSSSSSFRSFTVGLLLDRTPVRPSSVCRAQVSSLLDICLTYRYETIVSRLGLAGWEDSRLVCTSISREYRTHGLLSSFIKRS